MPHDTEKHHKLGKIVDSNLPGFRLRLRYPGSKPDEVERLDANGNPNNQREALYVEEFLGAEKIGQGDIRFPFQPPLDDLDEPKWILGGSLEEHDDKGRPVPIEEWNPFNKWLLEISSAARNYNASLYRLRRLHLIAENNPHPMDRLPTDPPKDLTPAEAEEDYKVCVAKLRDVIDSGTKSLVDFVEINGYIVSIRAVEKIFVGDAKSAFGPQPAGSSSSHWSLSSAFSSSSSSSSSAAPAKR